MNQLSVLQITSGTGVLYGRSSAGSGTGEEITLGSSLSLTGGQLKVVGLPNGITFDASGAGVAAGTSYTGSVSRLISYNTIGAAPSASPTFTGKVTVAASTTAGAGLNIPQGVAPTAPANGDIWTTSAGVYARINGATVGPFGTGGSGSPSASTPANVKDYGAVGNGSTDDTAAINSAIAALNAGTISILYFPPGTYKITASLTAITRAGALIYGAGPRQSIISQYGNVDTLQFVSTAPTTTRLSDCAIFNLGFDQSGVTAPTAGIMLRISRLDRFYANNVDIRNAFRGLLIESGADQHWNNTTIAGPSTWSAVAVGTYNVRLTNYTGTTEVPSEIFFTNFNWKGALAGGNAYLERSLIIECGDGLHFVGGHLGFANVNLVYINPQANASLSCLNFEFEQTYIDGSSSGALTGAAVELAGSTTPMLTGIKFSGGAIRNFNGVGIRTTLSSLRDLSVDSVQFSNNGKQHVNISGCYHLSFTGNYFVESNTMNTAMNAIDLNCGQSIFSNNRVMASNFGNPVGLNLIACSDCIISSNLFAGAGTDMAVDSGCTRVEFSDNRKVGSDPSVASAEGMILPMGYDVVTVTGSANLSNISGTNIAGYTVTLLFTGTASINDNLGNVDLNGNFIAQAGYTLTLMNNGTKWVELSRTGATGIVADPIPLATDVTTDAPAGGAPTTGVKLFAAVRANRRQPAYIAPTGRTERLQSFLGSNDLIFVDSPGAGAASTVVYTQVGTSMATDVGTITHPALATTNFLTTQNRRVLSVAATANLAMEAKTLGAVCTRRSTGGGFHFSIRWGLETVLPGTGRFFAGLANTATAFTATADPLGNIAQAIGVFKNSADTTLRLMLSAAAGTNQTITLTNTGAVGWNVAGMMFQLEIFCARGDAGFGYRVTRWDATAGTTTFDEGYVSTGNMPAIDTLFFPHLWAVNVAATATSIAFVQMYRESD